MSGSNPRLGITTSPKRVVIKVGTKILSTPSGKLSLRSIRRIASEAASLMRGGIQTVLVSSGAIGAGMGVRSRRMRPRTLKESQALAALGQPILISSYSEALAGLGISAAQVLLTRFDLENRSRQQNARRTIDTLLEWGVLPIINENDTVSDEEIRFGDNDTLGALVANLIEADLFVILTDVDGFLGPGSVGRIPIIPRIEKGIEAWAGGAGTPAAVGGMATKLKAAAIVAYGGHPTVIASGKRRGVLGAIVSGRNIGTLFLPRRKRLSGRKRWILHHLTPRGVIVIDGGAGKALTQRGSSLLPSGVKGVMGRFTTGEAVDIATQGGGRVAVGLTNYSSADIGKLKGARSSEIKRLLGYSLGDEIIHRDNLVLIEEDGDESR